MELFRFPRQRMLSLRFLASYLLGFQIQAHCHDSLEDARAALRLYGRYKELEKAGTLHETLTEIYRWVMRVVSIVHLLDRARCVLHGAGASRHAARDADRNVTLGGPCPVGSQAVAIGSCGASSCKNKAQLQCSQPAMLTAIFATASRDRRWGKMYGWEPVAWANGAPAPPTMTAESAAAK